MHRILSAHRRAVLLALGAAGLLLVGAATGAVVLLSGILDTSATKQHFALTYWILEQGLRLSVQAHARGIPVPQLGGQAQLERGLACYRVHCEQCHGGPGVSREDFAKGQLPLANNLVQTGREWRAAELYWVTMRGIRMSGMPAWEFRLSEDDLWSLVAFMKHLPGLAPEDYAAGASRAGIETCVPGAIAARAADPRRGPVLLRQYACTTCHVIPGVLGPDAHVGPPLHRFARRTYISGTLPNTPENLVRWIRDPRSVDARTAMPDLGVNEAHARDIAAYLFTLD